LKFGKGDEGMAFVNLSKYFDLEGRSVVITGAGGALCGTLAIALAGVGMKVAVLDLRKDAAEKTAAAAERAGGKALAFACDVLDEGNLVAVGAAVEKEWGAPDCLINGAGGNDPRASTDVEFVEPDTLGWAGQSHFLNMDMAGFDKGFRLNFHGTVLPTKIFSRGMVARKSGSIVNFASMSAVIPLTKVPAYSAAKAAVANFTKWLAVHYSHAGVRVNAIAPGFVMTEQLMFLHRDQKTGDYTPRAKRTIAHTPMGRYGEPEELVGTVMWLLSDASRFVTGDMIPIDGGFSSYTI
jgi:NAD(P)-dependent dehydrogenase (short-subunit alcohol dehydrogenase family)